MSIANRRLGRLSPEVIVACVIIPAEIKRSVKKFPFLEVCIMQFLKQVIREFSVKPDFKIWYHNIM